MSRDIRLLSSQRELVNADYHAAVENNRHQHLLGNPKATSEYIYDNQYNDAVLIVEKFFRSPVRVVSIVKKTKVGMNGLMIELTRQMATHPDDEFIVDMNHIRILTGMSNRAWEDDFKESAPRYLVNHIFHHGQLRNSRLKGIKNALIIIDEIDTGDSEWQVLHMTLKNAGLLDVENMVENNNRFVFTSATMIQELYEMYRWGDLHYMHKMSVPSNYIGHAEFLTRGIIQEFYPMDTDANMSRWISDDIVVKYKKDFRVHIVRIKTNRRIDIPKLFSDVCKRRGVLFKMHDSDDRLTTEEQQALFGEPLTKHIVLAVKGFYRRANLIPNIWKMRIGATHEYFTYPANMSVQIQGLPGRMTGYWKDVLDAGHVTGPYRTSIKAIEKYNNFYLDPYEYFQNDPNRFLERVFMNTEFITGIEPFETCVNDVEVDLEQDYHSVYADEDTVAQVCDFFGYTFVPAKTNEDGFKLFSYNGTPTVLSWKRAKRIANDMCIRLVAYQTHIPCYEDITDITTIRYIFNFASNTSPLKIQEADDLFPSLN